MNRVKKIFNKYSLKIFLKKVSLYLYLVPLGVSSNTKEKVWREEVKKGLAKYIIPFNKLEMNSETGCKYIFVCWLQGFDNAPKIVQRCIDSIKRNSEDYEVIEINESNYSNYVDIPKFIRNRWKNGKMSNAHFSDILRLYLLDKFGGVWIDSTVYLFDKIPNIILTSNRFLYQVSYLDNFDNGVSNWFIYSKNKNDPFIKGLKLSLINYWKFNVKPDDYFIMHDFITVMSELPGYEKLWSEIPYVENVAPHLLQKCLYDRFDLKYLEYIRIESSIQKLTYKLEPSLIKEDSYYNKIINRKI